MGMPGWEQKSWERGGMGMAFTGMGGDGLNFCLRADLYISVLKSSRALLSKQTATDTNVWSKLGTLDR